VLLPIDQLEELFKVSPDGERAAFLRLMADLIDRKVKRPFMVVATSRSDVLERLSAEMLARQLKATKSDGIDPNQAQDDLARIYDTYVLTPMPLARIKDLVEGPAHVANLGIEQGLAPHIEKDVKDLNALPLLALTLSLLYQQCKARAAKEARERKQPSWPSQLTIADYESLGDAAERLRPIANAVKRVVEQALGGINPAATDAEMTALRDAFVPHMVRLNTETGETLRQPALRSDLPPESLRLVDALRDAGLLTERGSDTQPEGHTEGTLGAIIEVTHEALFKAWKVLDQWLNDNRSFLLDLERIRAARVVWEQTTDDADPGTSPPRSGWAELLVRLRDALGMTARRGKAAALLHGPLLSRAREWLDKYPQRFRSPDMAPIRTFIAASIKAEEDERAKR
jgi:DNA-binding transcriptional ArsR family regulator